jgi:hypothetical protein
LTELKSEPNRFSDIQNTLSAEEIRVIKELRKVDWGKLTVIKKGGVIKLVASETNVTFDN